jgi:hypothetical protein
MSIARRSILPVLLLLALVALPQLVHACPNCKESFMDGDGASVAAGYNSSIMLMIGVPIALLAGATLRLWWASKRARQRATLAAPGHLDPPIDTTR